MAKHIDIWLVRHGERLDHVNPEWMKTAKRPFDPPLTDAGRNQAKQTGERLKNEKIQRIFCSPFLRCVETAQGIAGFHKDVRICIEPGVGESMDEKDLNRHFELADKIRKSRGTTEANAKPSSNEEEDIETQHPTELVKLCPNVDVSYKSDIVVKLPETANQTLLRTLRATHKLLEQCAKEQLMGIAFVTHATPLQYLLSALGAIDVASALAKFPTYTSVTHCRGAHPAAASEDAITSSAGSAPGSASPSSPRKRKHDDAESEERILRDSIGRFEFELHVHADTSHLSYLGVANQGQDLPQKPKAVA